MWSDRFGGREFMEIGPVPAEENCAQVGDAFFKQVATIQMETYIDQLYREFPNAREHGISFVKKWYPHEFGTYGEVNISWPADNELATEYALDIEHNLPSHWDEQSLETLIQELETVGNESE